MAGLKMLYHLKTRASSDLRIVRRFHEIGYCSRSIPLHSHCTNDGRPLGSQGRGNDSVTEPGANAISASKVTELQRTTRPLHVAQLFGREDELDRIARAFHSTASAVALTPANLNGERGVGKTTIARAYFEQNRERYAGLCWINGMHPNTIPHQLIANACRHQSQLCNETILVTALDAAIEMFSSPIANRPWLFVLDDLTAFPEHHANLWTNPATHLLITSPRPFWPSHVTTIPIDIFPTDVAARYVRTMANCHDMATARSLALRLGYHPLALAQAAAYCRNASCEAAEFAAIADQCSNATAATSGTTPAHVTTAIALATIKSQSPLAEPLLYAMAHLAPTAVDYAWFSSCQSPPSAAPETPTPHPTHLDDLDLLTNFALLQSNTSDGGRPTSDDHSPVLPPTSTVAIHPLVQDIILQDPHIQATPTPAVQTAHDLIINACAQALVPNPTQQRDWEQEASLLLHLEHLETTAPQFPSDYPEASRYANQRTAIRERLLDQTQQAPSPPPRQPFARPPDPAQSPDRTKSHAPKFHAPKSLLSRAILAALAIAIPVAVYLAATALTAPLPDIETLTALIDRAINAIWPK